MPNYVVVPKRKTLQRDTTEPDVVNNTVVSTGVTNLSQLGIDIDKDWNGYSIENVGEPSNNLAAVRKYDILSAIEFIINGGGSAITTGQKGHLRLPFAGTIISVALVADQVGSLVVDIWKDTTDNFPPTDADSITSSTPPTLASTQISLDSILAGWTKTFAYGDFLAFNVDSCTTITRATLVLVVRRS